MTALSTFEFDGYTLRPARLDDWDINLAAKWTTADPDHAGRVHPHFWLEQKPYCDSFLLFDSVGPVFFFKIRRCEDYSQLPGSPATVRAFIELHIQFMPDGPTSHARTVKGLTCGLNWLEPLLKTAGFEEIYFDSNNQTLIRFCVRRLGFVQERHSLRKRLFTQPQVVEKMEGHG